MTRIGMVDLSTSHPGIFAPLLASLGATVTAVLDADESRTRAFPAATPAGDLAELAAACDVVMLLGADWDQRLDHVRTLAALGVPVFVDKPMAGTAGELRAIAELAGSARIDGGSALRVAPEAVALRRGGRPERVAVTCGGHPFYYGIHAVALAVAVLGPGLVAASGRPADVGRTLDGIVRHGSGVDVSVSVSAGEPTGGFRATVDGQLVEPAAEAFYPALLRDALARLTTGDGRPGRELVEGELALLAMAWSASTGGEPVRLEDVPAGFRPWRAG